MRDREIKLSELELGPHFITVFGTPRPNMLNLAKTFYQELKRSRKDIFKFQQKNLAHEPNDPNVYHPYGQPKETGKEYTTHFHIRFPGGPSEEDVTYVINTLSKFISMSDKVRTYKLLSDDKDGIGYPLQEDREYFDYIEFLRKGDWKNGI